MLRGSAFVPAHITGFFEIHTDAEDVRQQGSRGAGLCLSLGVNTTVEVEESDRQDIHVLINNRRIKAQVTELAVKNVIGDGTYEVIVRSELDLPQGQGFGMSGAGALSAIVALRDALDLETTREQIICAAHSAEVRCSTGLGDVLPQATGGVVVRKKEGCPPFGVVEKIENGEAHIVLCIVGEPLSTKDIITDPFHVQRINQCGKKCLDKLMQKPDLEEMMKLSQAFTKETGLISPEVEKAIAAAERYGSASMSMLGYSVFAIGETENMVRTLVDFGEVYVCRIDEEGARVIKGQG